MRGPLLSGADGDELAGAAIVGEGLGWVRVAWLALHQRQRTADILFDQQDRGAHRVDFLNLFEGRIGHHRRQPERRFVEH